MALRVRSRLGPWSPVRPLARPAALRCAYASQITAQSARDRAAIGVFTPKAAAIFVAVGTGLFFYFKSEKEKLEEQRRQERVNMSYGRPDVGGPFQLMDQHGAPFSEKDLLGTYSLVYFGFTNCPDICPDELDKMGRVVDIVEQSLPLESPLRFVRPIFVSVDPARDSVKAVRRYALDFHPRLIALRGSFDAVKSMCKAYRVYFSSPPPLENERPDSDYLVDHSIYFYLMDPAGVFVQAFGKATTAEEVAIRVQEEIERWTSKQRST